MLKITVESELRSNPDLKRRRQPELKTIRKANSKHVCTRDILVTGLNLVFLNAAVGKIKRKHGP